MNWGYKIVIVIVAFMATIITMVVICMKQDISLVAPDYYKQEIAYQNHIDQQKNALEASDQMKFEYNSRLNQLIVMSKSSIEGEVHMYRPSNAKEDIKVPFNVKSGEMASISTKGLSKGLWKAKLSWKVKDKVFYIEKTVII